MSEVQAKRGDTLILACTRTDAAGDPVDLTGQTITSQMKYLDESINLSVLVTDAAAGTLELFVSAAAMENASIGRYSCDVEFDTGTRIISTETFYINVLEDITIAG